MKTKQALIIFAREPRPGHVKTRLLTDLDGPLVAGLYQAFVEDVMNVALTDPEWTSLLFYADPDPEPPFLSGYRPRCAVISQRGADLGERMFNAAEDCFGEGFERVVIVGTDCLDFTRDDLRVAFDRLTRTDYCIGPSTDGGYYLIGTRVSRREPFDGVEWGTATVLSKTLEIVEKIQHNISLLPEKEDIDTFASLVRFMARMEDSPGAPITKKFLREHKHRFPTT